MMDTIHMVDLKGQYLKIKSEIDTAMQEVIDSAVFVKGGKVDEFQRNLADYLHVKHVIPVGNGTDALQIALMALGLKPGDEVIMPTFTFVSTAEVAAVLGLKPVLVDVDYDSFNISIEALKKAITPNTKAIIPVHLFGQNAPIEDILAIAKEHNLFVVEDACQSIGSIYAYSNGEQYHSGCMGDIGCTSFFPSKTLGCFGDGGAVFTNNTRLAETIRSIANHGMTVRYHYDTIGVNSRLDSLQAAILDVKLKYLDDYIRARQAVAQAYDAAFSKESKLVIPYRNPASTHVFHQYTLKLNGVDRDALQAHLQKQGIPSMVYYPIPLHLQKAYRSYGYKEGDFPIAENLSKTVLSLPMHTELSEEQVQYIIHHVLEFL